MKPENKNMDDFEYLSQQGFEKVKVSDKDIDALKKTIKAKTFSFGRFYVGLSALCIGILIGGLLIIFLDKKEKGPALKKMEQGNEVVALDNENIIELDTVSIVKENFINPLPKTKALSNKEKSSESLQTDSADIIVPKPIDLSLLESKKIREEKLKFMINSPVFYLYDMKVTNYTTLYFKKNHFIPFSGTSAAYSTAMENAQGTSHLKDNPDYFLHEEIAQAMLYFKKGKYDYTINSLNLVHTYNTDDLNCDFYLAMCYYYKKNYSRAVDLFDKCITNTNNAFLQEASFYKAVSLYESGEHHEANRIFKKIAEENEFYAEKAKSYL